MEFYQDRTIQPGQKVKVYVNLHKQGKFSIVDMESGLVCAYASTCLLKDVVLFSSDAGRKRVRDTRRKLVHAWARGILVATDLEESKTCTEEVQYNPYFHEGFTDSQGSIIQDAPLAFFKDKKIHVTKYVK